MTKIAAFFVLILMVPIVYAQENDGNGMNHREKFNSISAEERQANKEQVAEIATELGIDLSTREGKREMADYLIENDQADLLPPRRNRKARRGSESRESSNLNMESDSTQSSSRSRSQRRPPRRSRGDI